MIKQKLAFPFLMTLVYGLVGTISAEVPAKEPLEFQLGDIAQPQGGVNLPGDVPGSPGRIEKQGGP